MNGNGVLLNIELTHPQTYFSLQQLNLRSGVKKGKK